MSVIFAIPSIGQTQMEPPSVTYLNGTTIADSLWSGIPGVGNIPIGTVNINFNDTNVYARKQKKFALGYQWGMGLAGMNQRLGVNTINNFFDYTPFADELYATLPADSTREMDITWGRVYFLSHHPTISMQFDPEAPLFAANGSFTPRTGDTSGATFGFKFRDMTVGSIISSPSDVNFNRYILKKDSVGGDTVGGRMVLKYPVSTDRIVSLGDHSTDLTTQLLNGEKYYLTLNLRRLDFLDLLSSTDTILTIKAPYWKFPVPDSSFEYNADSAKFIWRHFNNTHPSTIRFDSVFMQVSGTLDTMRTSRGLMDNHLTAHVDSIFVIRKNMLPRWTSAGTHDITISAFFRTDRMGTVDTSNPRLRNLYGGGSSLQIDSLGIEVKYFGRTNIAIDWLRFETPDARALFRGNLDKELAQELMLEQEILKRRNSITNRKVRISSFYHFDECGGLPAYWRGIRYNTKMLEGLNTSEGGAGGDYINVTGQSFFWGNPPHTNLLVHVPFSRYSGTWGYDAGWDGGSAADGTDSYRLLDSANGIGNYSGSAYELYSSTGGTNNINYSIKWCCSTKGIWDHWNFNDTNQPYRDFNAKYDVLAQASHGPLMQYDIGMYLMYQYNQTMLYGTKPWWSNFWVLSGWTTEWNATLQKMQIYRSMYDRPQTGEEYRENAWVSLILGTKGLMYDRFYYGPTLVNINDTSASMGSDSTYRKNEKARYTTPDNYGHLGVTGGYIGLPDSIVNGTNNGEILLRSEAAGSDWLHRGDYSHIDQYCNLDSIASQQGVDTNHIYLGRKSVRLEVLKIHDRIDIIGDTLMRLQLMGWLGKGYRTLISARNNDTSYLTKFIKIDSGIIKTRPFWRSFADGWDSTFCDITVLKDTNVSMDNVFYVGVVNRRTNPLLRLSDTTELQFYPTVEFDSLTLGSDSVWQSRRYKQGGAREISVPFNFNFPNGYALLHVKELGGGIDTIIGQDVPLVANFLPGEGKMFSVKILPPDTTLTGVLSYTNQRKLVGFPIRRADGTESDSMYYHLTYHRYDSATSRNKVYYRRSNKVWVNSSSENIKWQSEIPLSSKVALSRCVSDTIMSLNSTYPSLVVRFDSTASVNKVYIVYSCATPTLSDPCYSMFYGLNNRKIIVENILRAEDSIQTADTAKRLAIFNGTMGVYGTPMINASDSGNFYCWSDSITGISAGWKRPNVRILSTIETIGAALFVDPDNHNPATQPSKHPSVNSYSRLRLKENDCALVWEQHLYDSAAVLNSHIFYTRLHVVNDTIHHFLPPYLPVPNGVIYVDANNTVAKLNGGETTYADPTLPSVYRELTDSISPDSGTMMIQRNYIFDCAVWNAFEMTGSPGYPLGSIYRRILWIKDTNGLADKWGSDGLTRITNGSLSYLLDASISQGNSNISTVPTPITNESDSSVVITFSEVSAVSILGVPPTYRLWQLQSSMFFDAINADSTLYLQDNLIASKTKIIDNYALYGQTAALPRVEKQSDWRRNRRVYQRQTDPVTYGIQTSPRYFLKQSEQPNPLIFTGFSNGESKYILENPVLNYRILNLRRVKKTAEDDTEEQLEFTDTLRTGWFTVGEAAEFSFRTIGANSDLVTSFVERRSDGELFPVELRPSDDTTALKTEIELEQGGDEEYRFFVVKSNETSIILPHYRNEILLSEIETITGFEKGNGRQVVFLGKERGGNAVSVYPNPARDEVNITIKGTERSEVIIVSAIGGEQTRFEAEGEKTAVLNTSNFSSGVYVARVRRKGMVDAVVPFVVVR